MSDSNETHFKGKVAQKAVIRRGNEILISRDVGDGDLWELPGGRLNDGESPKIGLVREIKEELGVEVKVGEMFYSEQFFHTRDKANMLLMVYEATLKNDTQEFIFGPNEIAEVKWINKNQLTEINIYDDYRRVIGYYFANYL